MKNLIVTMLRLVTVAVFIAYSSGVFAEIAGQVQFVNGSVQQSNAAGQTHMLQKGDAVNEGDTLNSATAATAQIKMRDGGLIALRPETQLKVDSFKFNGKQDGSEQGFFSLVKGGFRAVTGLIGQLNKGSYRIVTPSATIGIRGTDHETLVVVPGSSYAILAPAGTYNKVNTGETSLSNGKGEIAILPNQMGYAGADGVMPQLQPLNPNLFNALPAPLPQVRGGAPGEVRDSVVVDNTLQEVGVGSGYAPPLNVTFLLKPITATVTTTTVVPPGVTAPNGGVVTTTSVITF